MTRPNAQDQWRVLPHGELQQHADNLWTVAGELPRNSLGRVMTLARMADGRLLIHNAIALEPPLMAQVEAWAQPAVLVVPNRWHRMDAPAYKRRYPRLQVVCPAGARQAVSKVVPVDATYGQFAGDETVSLAHMEGSAQREGYLQLRSPNGVSLVFNDLLFNMDHQPGLAGLIMRLMGSTGAPGVTRLGRWAFMKDRGALRDHLRRLADTPGLIRVIIMHGKSVAGPEAAGLLRTAADRL